MRIEPLTEYGQIKSGDLILLKNRGVIESHKVKDVVASGTDREEIILKRKKNIYFIVSMALEGSSWAKSVHIVKSDARGDS